MRRVCLVGCATLVLFGACGSSDDSPIDAKAQSKYDVAVPNGGIDMAPVQTGPDGAGTVLGVDTSPQASPDVGAGVWIDGSSLAKLDGGNTTPGIDAGIDAATTGGPDGKPDVAIDAEVDTTTGGGHAGDGGNANAESEGGAVREGGSRSEGGSVAESGASDSASDVGRLTFVVANDDSDDIAAWQQAVGGNVVVETFDDAALVEGLSVSSTTNGFKISGGHFADGPDGRKSTVFSFNPSVLGAGLYLDLNPDTVGTGLDIHVLFQDGNREVIEVRNNTTNAGSSTEGFNGFVGFVGSIPITGFEIYEGTQTNLGTYEAYYGDNLVFAPVR
jgi:hypothetical protein